MADPSNREARPRVGLLSAWASRDGGGVFEALVAQCALVADCGYQPIVFALADSNSQRDRERFGSVAVHVFPVRGPEQIGYAPGMNAALVAAQLDLVHLHGIWKYPSHVGARWAARTHRPYVVSPHGMLDPWIVGRGRLKKAVARAGYERRGWRHASRFHALTPGEAADVAREVSMAPTVVVPNFVPVPTHAATVRAKSIVYLGRIHPKKNLDALIDGWRALTPVERDGARLTIAGWGEAAHVAALEARLAERADDGIAFAGPVFGAAKTKLLGEAAFVVLASHSEGLPIAILEAWAAGTPTLMSRHCHLEIGFERGAGLDCGTTAASVAAALRTALAIAPDRWQAMADSGRTLVRERFSRDVVLSRWRAIYGALLGEGARR